MIIVLLSYVGDVTPHRAAHVAWLKESLASGRLVTAGRQPESGGVLIANGDRAEVEAWAAQDPYQSEGVVTATYVEFTPSFVAPGLESLLP
ncbi:MAG: GTP cyclohydrolase [Sphingomonadales bacterium]|nr:MAG: GTP cyclohydrolase [Sphingomonadales bacterium]